MEGLFYIFLASVVAGLSIWAYVARKHNPEHIKLIEDELKAKVQWPLDKS